MHIPPAPTSRSPPTWLWLGASPAPPPTIPAKQAKKRGRDRATASWLGRRSKKDHAPLRPRMAGARLHRLARELELLRTDPPPGVAAWPVDEADISRFHASESLA